MTARRNLLVAGLGGASLGTEICKCLAGLERWRVFGCDVSPYAYGHYAQAPEKSFLVPREGYAEAVLELCRRLEVAAVVPGGEEPLRLLTEHAAGFAAQGVHLAANAPEVTRLCSDKGRFFAWLAEAGWPVPRTVTLRRGEPFRAPSYPCILKPAQGTGGSALVFLAEDEDEARLFATEILRQREAVVVQEYVPDDEGEFTIGVLHLPDGALVGTVAMRRLLHAKLSVMTRTRAGVVSSGYSQGLIDDFPALRAQAEALAALLGSRGPLNVQARVRGGRLVPFEANPRFSASTWLRAMAGFNEIDLYLRAVLDGERPVAPRLRPGWYLRSLAETFVPPDGLVA